MKFDCSIQERYEAELEASPRLVQRLLLFPLRGLISLIAQFPGYLLQALSSCGTQFVAGYHQLSSLNTTGFLQAQRKGLYGPGAKYLWFLYLPIYWFILLPVLGLVKSLYRIVSTSDIPDDASHVPTFYAPVSLVRNDDNWTLFSFVLPLGAAIFGAVHLIAWRFQFPSHDEQLLWRIDSLTITAFPSVALAFIPCAFIFSVIFYSLESFVDIQLEDVADFCTSENIVSKFLVFFLLTILFLLGAGSLVAYMIARLLLVADAVFLLRKQPESAFYAIDWSHFLPHI